MESNIFKLNDKIYSNNNDTLLDIVNTLNQLINRSKDNHIIKTLGDVITKLNSIINQNKINVELIRNDIFSLYNKFNKRFAELKVDNTKNKELKYETGRYIGQV